MYKSNNLEKAIFLNGTKGYIVATDIKLVNNVYICIADGKNFEWHNNLWMETDNNNEY